MSPVSSIYDHLTFNIQPHQPPPTYSSTMPRRTQSNKINLPNSRSDCELGS